MTRNPIGLIKNVAVESLKVPTSVAGAAMGVARSATHKATGVVTSLVDHRSDDAPPERSTGRGAAVSEAADREATEAAEKVAEQVRAAPDEPVNVTEALDLDPSPVAKPKRTKPATPKPVTDIDAAATASDVDATPADVARKLEG